MHSPGENIYIAVRQLVVKWSQWRLSQRGVHILVHLAHFPTDQRRSRVMESAVFRHHGPNTLAVILDGERRDQLRSRLRLRLDVDHADCGEYSWYGSGLSLEMTRRVVPNSASFVLIGNE